MVAGSHTARTTARPPQDVSAPAVSLRPPPVVGAVQRITVTAKGPAPMSQPGDVTVLDGWQSGLTLLPTTDEDVDWHDRALCAQTDPEAFFPEKGGSTREAKKICTGCEVRAECLSYALANDERFGIWGGLSERERRRLKRQAS
ncbi:WhiB family transcriptional regulator [Nakamurella endophytica]